MQDDIVKCADLMIKAQSDPSLVPKLMASLEEAEHQMAARSLTQPLRMDKACQTDLMPGKQSKTVSIALESASPSHRTTFSSPGPSAAPRDAHQKTMDTIAQLLACAVPGSDTHEQLTRLLEEMKTLADEPAAKRKYQPCIPDDTKAVKAFEKWQLNRKLRMIKHRMVMTDLFGVLKTSMMQDLKAMNVTAIPKSESPLLSEDSHRRGLTPQAPPTLGVPSKSSPSYRSRSPTPQLVAFNEGDSRTFSRNETRSKLLPLRSHTFMADDDDLNAFGSRQVTWTPGCSPGRQSFKNNPRNRSPNRSAPLSQHNSSRGGNMMGVLSPSMSFTILVQDAQKRNVSALKLEPLLLE